MRDGARMREDGRMFFPQLDFGGIPAYMAFNYFTGIINDFVLQVESSASELIEVVTLRLTLDQED